jgi:O-antigen/teichoic acid export membrane protein
MSSRLAMVMRSTDPLTRNGYALVLNTLVSGGLGIIYWVVAARLFTPSEVGRDAAVITVMTLLSSIGGMNLAGALVFVLPRVGASARRYIATSYAASAGLVAVLVAGFLIIVARTGGPLAFLDASVPVAGFFLLAACAWTLFTLQDGVLTGLRAAPWVLGENTAYGVIKLVVLIALAGVGLTHGIYLSWVLPVLVLVPVVNVLVFRRLLPAVADREDRLPDGSRGFRRFVGLNYGSALFYQGYVNAIPLLVLGILGSRVNGFFYVAWTWSCAIDLVTHSMGASLTVEGSAEPARLPELVRHVVRRLAVLVGGGGLVAIVAAPWLLSAYGPAYADESAGLLRLLVLGALPRAVVIVAQSAARARGEGALVLWSEAVTFLLVMGLAVPILDHVGAIGVGIAWLVGNAVVAVLVLPALMSCLRDRLPAR